MLATNFYDYEKGQLCTHLGRLIQSYAITGHSFRTVFETLLGQGIFSTDGMSFDLSNM